MPFVKLDCGILNSTLWFERDAREIFITALLMAEPFETTEPLPQIEIHSLELTGWSVPPGWYGFVPAASVGILHRAKVDEASGLEALKRMGEPEESSRSKDYEGRRLVRVDGGFIILNFMKYRDRDYTTAERSRRYRERLASRRDKAASHRDITQAESRVQKADTKAEEQERPPRPLISGESNPKTWGKLHGEHVPGFCDWVCLPEFLFAEFCRKSATAKASDGGALYVKGWASAVRARFEGQAVGDNLKFWRARWDESHATKAVKDDAELDAKLAAIEAKAKR
jgi:hypothetical protein